jgi:hypothetical protein
MITKRFTIKIKENEDETKTLQMTNEGFEEFELIGILFHALKKRQLDLNELINKGEHLEKEMD